MPLSLVNPGEERFVRRIGGNPETKTFLESLGFTAGSMVKVVSVISGNIIVQVKESRIAISSEMANKIFV